MPGSDFPALHGLNTNQKKSISLRGSATKSVEIDFMLLILRVLFSFLFVLWSVFVA